MIINKDYRYLHFALYQYYLGYIQEFEADEVPLEHWLHFEFEEDTYSIIHEVLRDRAYEEMDKFLAEYQHDDIKQKIKEIKDEVAKKLTK